MATTFGILAALVLAISAFVAFKVKEEHQAQIDASKDLDIAIGVKEKTSKALGEEIDGLVVDKEAANKARDDFKAKLAVQKEENDAAKAAVAEKETELADLEESVAKAEDDLKELGPIKELAPQIESLKADISELEDELASLEANNSRLAAQKSSTSETSEKLSEILSFRTTGKSLPTLKTRVRSISRALGFVTLAGGDNSGVVNGSKLSVMRGNDKVADLTVTAVSANSATADIIATSIKEGESVIVGDKVVPFVESAK